MADSCSSRSKNNHLSIPKKKKIPSLNCPRSGMLFMCFTDSEFTNCFKVREGERGRESQHPTKHYLISQELEKNTKHHLTCSVVNKLTSFWERELHICTLRTALREPGSNIIHLVRFHFDNHQLRGSHEKNIPVDVIIIMREAIDTRKFRVRPPKAWSILF